MSDNIFIYSISVLIIGLFVTLTIIAAKLKVKKMRRVWTSFAQRNGFNCDLSGTPTVHGLAEGRSFLLENFGNSSRGSVSVMLMELSLKGAIPQGLFVCQNNFTFSSIKKIFIFLQSLISLIRENNHSEPLVKSLLNLREIKTGDQEFDNGVVIAADNPQEALSYLTALRRNKILELTKLGIEIQGGKLQLKSTKIITDEAKLNKSYDCLLSATQVLDN